MFSGSRHFETTLQLDLQLSTTADGSF